MTTHPLAWLTLPGDRVASELGKPMRRPARGRALIAPYQLGDRGFIVLGAPTPRIRPTIAHGYVRGTSVELVAGELSSDDMAALRDFWRLGAAS